jgi:hypothetical protein
MDGMSGIIVADEKASSAEAQRVISPEVVIVYI